jgi:hypothetical protein
MPLAMTTNSEDFVEFEVPYLSELNILPVRNLVAPDPLYGTPHSRAGTLVINTLINQEFPPEYQVGNDLYLVMEILVAFGDGARFGGLFTVPNWRVLNNTPDDEGMNLSYWVQPWNPLPVMVTPQMFKNLGSELGGDLDSIIEEVIPTNIVGDLLGGLLDKPTESNNPTLIVPKTAQFLPHAVNVEHIPSLTLYPKAQTLCDSEHFASKSDEMNINYLLKELSPCRLATSEWTTNMEPGEIIFQSWVGPMMEELSRETVHSGSLLRPTMLDFVAGVFSFWRGGIQYTVEAVVNGFYSGRLQISFYPGMLPEEVTITPDPWSSTSVYSTLMDVKDSVGMTSVIAPYLADTPWKRVYDGNPNESTLALYNSGFLQVSVYTPLVTSNNVSNSVDINIYVRAASDFELTGLYNNNCSLVPFGQTPAAKKPANANTAPAVIKKRSALK